MEGLKPINVSPVNRSSSISNLETLQLLINKKITDATKTGKKLLEKSAKLAKEGLIPLKNEISATSENAAKIHEFASSMHFEQFVV